MDTQIRLSVAEVLRGMDLGIVTHTPGRGFAIAERHCHCGVRLPKTVAVGPNAGSLDTFPRCSRHAF